MSPAFLCGIRIVQDLCERIAHGDSFVSNLWFDTGRLFKSFYPHHKKEKDFGRSLFWLFGEMDCPTLYREIDMNAQSIG